jgi:glucose-1-phosphate thymidylyltransferase
MKGLVLAGGKGSRLRPFTYSGAKQLVPIANTPVLHFPVRQLVEAGITEIGIVVGDTEAQIREAMGDGLAFGARFTYIRQPEPAGIAHAVLVARPFLGRDPFVLYLGDNVLMGGITSFVDRFRAANAGGAVVLKSVEDPRAFGVAVLQGERLVRVVEKPADPPGNLAVIGVYAFSAAVHDAIARQSPSARGELEIADAINGLIESGSEVLCSVTDRYWIDTGKMEDMLAANRAVLDTIEGHVDASAAVAGTACTGPVRIAAGAVVENCRITGPVVIGAGARLRGCSVGPHVAIGDGCTLESVTIGNAIVMERSVLADCPGVIDSMIGRFSRVTGAPTGSRLTLGDHSCFEAAP